MESKNNAAVQLLKNLGVYAALESTAVTIDQPKPQAKVKVKATPAQKKRIAELRNEQNYKEIELKRLKRITKGKIKTINNLPKREVFKLFENQIVVLKGTATSLRG